MKCPLTIFSCIIFGGLVQPAFSDPVVTKAIRTQLKSDLTMKEQQALFLKSLEGKWTGTVRTWFQPGKLADDSKVEGHFTQVGNGAFLRHTYTSSMKGKPRTGETTIAFNHVAGKYQVSWFDDFHMSYGLLMSEGSATESGFAVKGSYAVGKDQPDWSWETVYELSDDRHLTITAYNILPTGEKAKAVETKYVRQPSK